MSSLISIGSIIDQSIHRYREHLKPLLGISLWIVAGYPFFFVSALLFHTGTLTASKVIAAAALAMIGFLVSLSASILTFNALVLASRVAQEGKRVQAAALLREARKRFWPAVALWIAVGVITLSAILLLAPGFALLTVPALRGLTVAVPILGVFLTFVGGLVAAALVAYLGVTYIFAPFALLLEGRTVAQSINRAHALVRGRWFASALRVVVPKLTFLVILIFASFVVMTLINIFGAMLLNPEAVREGTLSVSLVVLVKRLIATLLTAVATPLLILADSYVFSSFAGSKDAS